MSDTDASSGFTSITSAMRPCPPKFLTDEGCRFWCQLIDSQITEGVMLKWAIDVADEALRCFQERTP